MPERMGSVRRVGNDVITSIGVILCLVDPVVGLKNIARCLAPGGYLVCYLYSELGRRELMERRKAMHPLTGKQVDFEKMIRILEALDLYLRATAPERRR